MELGQSADLQKSLCNGIQGFLEPVYRTKSLVVSCCHGKLRTNINPVEQYIDY